MLVIDFQRAFDTTRRGKLLIHLKTKTCTTFVPTSINTIKSTVRFTEYFDINKGLKTEITRLTICLIV